MSVVNAEPYVAAVGQAREVTEKGAEIFRRGAEIVARNAGTVPAVPTIDLTEPVSVYFDLLQRSLDVNRGIATTWVELVNALSGQARDYAESFSRTLAEQGDRVADLTVEQSRKLEELADEQAERAAQAVKEQELAAKRLEREQAKAARAKARERYEGLTKAELADQLADRDLPKTGNVDELIDRLVAADGS